MHSGFVRLALAGALGGACETEGRTAGGPDASTGGVAGFPDLWSRCLPACILALYAACSPTERCQERPDGRVAYDNGVSERRETDPSGARVTVTFRADGRACVHKWENGTEFLWQNLEDARTARLVVTTAELRTAFCEGESYADVYRLPGCAALERSPPCR